MSTGNIMFGEGAKVVISPDEMRAWVMLPPPPKGVKYTADGLLEWLAQSNVLYGVDAGLVRGAIDGGKYHELIEVAKGMPPIAGSAGQWILHIEKTPFTGLKGNADGSLFYDDFSFLTEAEAGKVLVEVIAATPGQPGVSVKGIAVEAKDGAEGTPLTGSGFDVSADGRYFIAPGLSHVSFVGEELIVTPLLKLDGVSPETGPVDFDGNVLVEGDVLPGSDISATGSVFVVGRAASSTISAGRNILLSTGMRSQGGFAKVSAKENVWGAAFEVTEIIAGGDVCANLLSGCEVKSGGRAIILGGRAAVTGTNLYAKSGIVAGQLGSERNEDILISAGMDADLIARCENIENKIAKLNVDIQALQQNLTAFERVNRMKLDKGRGDNKYKEMIVKKEQSISVLNILNNERLRAKRALDAFSNVSIVVRGTAYPGVKIGIDTREMEIKYPMTKVKFRRVGDFVESVVAQSK